MTFPSNCSFPFNPVDELTPEVQITTSDDPVNIASDIADIMLAPYAPHTAELYGATGEAARRMGEGIYQAITDRVRGGYSGLDTVAIRAYAEGSIVKLVFKNSRCASILVKVRPPKEAVKVSAESLFNELSGFPSLPAGPSVFDLPQPPMSASKTAVPMYNGCADCDDNEQVSVDDLVEQLNQVRLRLTSLTRMVGERVATLQALVDRVTEDIEKNF